MVTAMIAKGHLDEAEADAVLHWPGGTVTRGRSASGPCCSSSSTSTSGGALLGAGILVLSSSELPPSTVLAHIVR